MFANAGVEAGKSVHRDWWAQAAELLNRWGCRPEMAEAESAWLHKGRRPIGDEPLQLVEHELSDLAEQLRNFIDGVKSGERLIITSRAMLEGWRVNPQTGKVEFEQVAALGPCQDVLSRALQASEHSTGMGRACARTRNAGSSSTSHASAPAHARADARTSSCHVSIITVKKSAASEWVSFIKKASLSSRLDALSEVETKRVRRVSR